MHVIDALPQHNHHPNAQNHQDRQARDRIIRRKVQAVVQNVCKVHQKALVKVHLKALVKVHLKVLVKVHPKDLVKVHPKDLVKLHPKAIIEGECLKFSNTSNSNFNTHTMKGRKK